LLTERAKKYRKQRKDLQITQKCEEIRQAVKALHAQGIFPSYRKLKQLLSDPAFLHAPEAHEMRNEVESKPSKKQETDKNSSLQDRKPGMRVGNP